jgi:hypothetical protein
LEQQKKNQVDFKNENYDCADVDLAFDQTMTMEQFMDTVTTHLEHRKKEHKSNRDKKSKKEAKNHYIFHENERNTRKEEE